MKLCNEKQNKTKQNIQDILLQAEIILKGAESTIKKGDTLVNKGESLLKKAEELEKSLGNSVGKRDDDQSDRRGVQVSGHRLAQEVDRTRARFMKFIENTERGKKRGGGGGGGCQ